MHDNCLVMTKHVLLHDLNDHYLFSNTNNWLYMLNMRFVCVAAAKLPAAHSTHATRASVNWEYSSFHF